MDEEGLEQLISTTVDAYVEKYKKSPFIVVDNLLDCHIEGNTTPIDEQNSIVATLEREYSCSIYHLPLRIQRRLPIYLTKELEIQICVDHYEYWAWSVEVFAHFERELEIPHSVEGNFFTPFRGALMSFEIIQTITDPYAKKFLEDKPFIVASASFLVLEAIIRQLCVRHGASQKEVENLRGLLPLAQKLLSLIRKSSGVSQEFKQDLDEFMEAVDTIWAPQVEKELNGNSTSLNTFREQGKQGLKGWRVIARWRNSLYHGNNTWLPKVYGVVLNLISLLMWHQVPDDKYEDSINDLMAKIENNKNDAWWLRDMNGSERVRAFDIYLPSD